MTKHPVLDSISPLSFHRSLDNLPYDVLLEICRSFGPQTETPRCYRAITSLGRVNRCLRSFALPFILREVSVSTAKRLSRLLHFFADSPPEYSSFVRIFRIRIDYTALTMPIDLPGLMPSKPVRFPNLLEFECMSWPYNKYLMDILSYSSATLQSISIEGSHPGDPSSDIPNSRTFPALKTLRLNSSSSQYRPLDSSSFSTLSSVSIYWLRAPMWRNLESSRLPVLRVLSLLWPDATSRSLCLFIHKHPTLREVNVWCRAEHRIRLEDVTKLIAGTGQWQELDAPEVTNENSYSWQDILLDCFAYSRIPIESDSPGSSWCATAVSLESTSLVWPAITSDFMNVVDLAEIPPFKEVTDLSLSLEYDQDHHRTMASFFRELSSSLKKWRHLRRFSFACGSPASSGNDSWGTLENPDIEDHAGPGFLACFHSSSPPYHTVYQKLISLSESARILREDVLFKEHIVNEKMELLREELVDLMGPECLNSDDNEIILMPAWELRHHPKVEKFRRLLARECPTLEEIRWYVGSFRPSPAANPVWIWKIIRSEGGEVKTVVGRLAWDRCIGQFSLSDEVAHPPLRVLVGEELAFASKCPIDVF